jgi:hypothetical protein
MMNLVTPKAGAKHELLFNKLAPVSPKQNLEKKISGYGKYPKFCFGRTLYKGFYHIWWTKGAFTLARFHARFHTKLAHL